MIAILHRLLPLIFPPQCPVCGELTDGTADQLCPACNVRLEEELRLPCPVCGNIAAECICRPEDFHEFLTAVGGRIHITAGFYQPHCPDAVLSKLIFSLKTTGDEASLRILSRLLSRELMKSFLAAGEDIRNWTFTYPPRSTHKRRAAGFDQAQKLAQMCAAETGAHYTFYFTRRGGREQKNLGSAERRANAETSLHLRRGAACRGARIILLDDIVTSGATVMRCAALLREAGAEKILCASALKTVPQKYPPKKKSGVLWFQEDDT